jgi:hypothetical protein
LIILLGKAVGLDSGPNVSVVKVPGCGKYLGVDKTLHRPKFGAGRGRGFELDPCLACVQQEQKAAIKDARFSAHFTRVYRFFAFDSSTKNIPREGNVVVGILFSQSPFFIPFF